MLLRIFLLLFIFCFFLVQRTTSVQHPDYKEHPCIRKCDNKTVQMNCRYNWTIEWYSVLSKACLDCPYNKTNCDRLNCVSANGVIRPIMTVNRMIPGPSLYVCQGDTIEIDLYNSLHLSEGTSIHWHGIKQKGTPFMDGVSMVTQCPVVSHTHFQYKFLAEDHGTHLWHAHAGIQRADGVFGPIIVRQYEQDDVHKNLYDFDLPEHVISVNDWINETSIAKFAGHHHNDGDNKPHSLLINGRGVLHNFFKNGSSEIIQTPRAIFSVEPGKKYRFRLINAGFLYCPIELYVDNHTLTVIASDGYSFRPYEVVSLIIYAGERYDFIINANQSIQNYWIKTKGYADCNVFKVFETAILSYKSPNSNLINDTLPGEPQLLNYEMNSVGLQLNSWNKFINNETRGLYTRVDEMRSVIDSDLTSEFLSKINTTNVKKFYFGMDFNKINNDEFLDERLYSLSKLVEFNRVPLYTPQINNISMMMPSSPVLYHWDSIDKSKICNDSNKNKVCPANLDYCSCIYLLEFDVGDVVEFVVVDEGFTFQSNHPMHLHGHSFAVLAIDKLNRSIETSYIKKLDESGLIKRNLDMPPIKDTVTVPVGGYTIIRFVADNPGTWMFHCHLDFHSEVGMAFLMKVGQNKDLPQEPYKWPQCGNYYYSKNLESSQSSIATGSKINFYLIFVLLISITLQFYKYV